MIIKNGMVFHEDQTFYRDTLFIEDGWIVDPQQYKKHKGQDYINQGHMDAEVIDSEIIDTEIIDAKGCYVLPGLVDIHSHGAVGFDFCDADIAGLKEILRYEYASGITSYCPTSMTLPKERLKEIFATAAAVSEEAGMARIAGINMEGPFLSPQKKGAHVKENICLPDAAFFRACSEACGGRICLVTIAPELEGAEAFIRELCGAVTISLGHTAADYETARAALEAGACHVTHLFNAMQPFSHREPGLVGAAAEDAACMAELICDGIHVHESAVRAAFQLFGDRVILISDSMRGTGLKDGCYELGGQQVSVSGARASLFDGTIAGSVTNLFDCMRQAVSFGIPLEQAVAAASVHPAESIGIYDTAGSLSPGKRGDVLLVDQQLHLVKVISG